MKSGFAEGWLWRLGRRIFSQAPLSTALIICANLSSQISLLVASFLPLKALILIGSTAVPTYYPESLKPLGIQTLVILLTGVAAISLLIHLASEKVVSVLSARGARKLIEGNRKLSLFEREDEIASRTYLKFARSAADLVFSLITLAAFAAVYPGLLVALCTVLVVIVATARLRWNSPGFPVYVRTHYGPLIRNLANLTFLLGFAFIVWDILANGSQSVLIGIICLLLVRQWSQRTGGFVQAIADLHQQKERIEGVFLDGRAPAPAASSPQNELWRFLTETPLGNWINPLIGSLDGRARSIEPEVRWVSTGTPDIAAFRLISRNGDVEENLLIKLFAPTRKSFARNEVTLLSSVGGKLPIAPVLLAVTQIESLPCHVLRMGPCRPADRDHLRELHRQAVRELMYWAPEPELVSTYTRSRAHAWSQLNPDLIARLKVVAHGSAAADDVDWLAGSMNDILEHLAVLPVQLTNADLRPDSIWEEPAGARPMLVHWGRWGMEPLGSQLLAPMLVSASLESLTEEVASHRPDARGVNPGQLALAAATHQFSAECEGQRYTEALERIALLRWALAAANGNPCGKMPS